MKINATKLDKKTIEICAAWVADALTRELMPLSKPTKVGIMRQEYKSQGLGLAVRLLDILGTYAEENRTNIDCFDRK